jgi:hypothetical protein
MKHLILTILISVHGPAIFGQVQLLQTNSKSRPYYVELNGPEGMVYPITRFHDLGASGYYMHKIDTLQKQPDGSYIGGDSRIIRENDKLYLIRKSGKTRKFQLNVVLDTLPANEKINNAYYQRQFVTMSREIHEAYSLSNHSFRDAFSTWKLLGEKQMKHREFSVWADKRISEIKDSVSALQDQYTRLTNYLTRNIRKIEYSALKDSLVQFRAGYANYFQAVMDTIAMRQPEYFFRLAEDLPDSRSSIFSSGIYSKRVYTAVKDLKGHDKIKQEFLKERKESRKMTFTAVGIVLLEVGLITWALIALI